MWGLKLNHVNIRGHYKCRVKGSPGPLDYQWQLNTKTNELYTFYLYNSWHDPAERTQIRRSPTEQVSMAPGNLDSFYITIFFLVKVMFWYFDLSCKISLVACFSSRKYKLQYVFCWGKDLNVALDCDRRAFPVFMRIMIIPIFKDADITNFSTKSLFM